MKDRNKSKEQLARELVEMRERIAGLEAVAEKYKRSEKVLMERERRFNDIVENAMAWFWEVDANGKYTYVSPVVEKISGYKPGEMLGKNFFDLFHPDDRKKLKNEANKYFDRKAPFREFINRNIHKSGRIVWLSTSGVPILDENGNLLGYRGEDTDITERKRAEEELRKSEERFRKIFDNIKDAIFVETPDGRILDVNKATCDLLGYTREELLSMRVGDVVAPDKAANLPPIIQEKTVKGSVYVETEELLKNGRQVPVEVSNTLVEIGGEKRVIAVLRDISVRKRAERELMERTNRINSQRAAILELSKEDLSDRDYALMRIVEVDARALGVERVNIWIFNEDHTEIVCLENYERSKDNHGKGMRISVNQYPAYFKALEKSRFIAADNALTDSGTREFADEYLIPSGISSMMDATVRLHGKTIGVVCHEHVGPMRQWTQDEKDFAGSIADMVSLALEASERKLAEEMLFHAQKMEAIGTLAGGLAHDFNNILAGIMGYAGLIQKRLDQESPLIEELKAVEGLSRRGADLTRALLTFSKRGRYHPKPFRINNVVEGVLKLVRKTSAEDISIEAELSPDVSNVFGDEGQLDQIFMNLCLNARQAMPRGGTLTIKTRNMKPGEEFLRVHPGLKEGSYVVVIVSDTGIGIDAGTRSRIFEPFFTTRAAQSGTGLGLSIVSGIVEKHGGCIEVESEVGIGTTFKVYLPATEGAVFTVPSWPVENLKGDETILMVDDESDFRRGTGSWLKMNGYTIIEAASGEEALEIVEERKGSIDIVLLDMVMGGMGGPKTFGRLKKMCPGLPVIVCTGYSMDTSSRRMVDVKADGFINKPFELVELAHKIRKVLDSH